VNDFIPIGETILCEPIEDKHDLSNEFVYENSDNLPIYRILKIGSNNLKFDINVGDIIICNSIGNMIEDNNKKYHLFSYNNIIGKIK
jgi:hypothetical protein